MPPSSRPRGLSSKYTARGSSQDLSNLPSDLGLGPEIGPFTPRLGSLLPRTETKKLDISQEAQQHISTELVAGLMLVQPAWITQLPSHKDHCSNEPRKGVGRLSGEVSVTKLFNAANKRKD
jgi:hypothetical protein